MSMVNVIQGFPDWRRRPKKWMVVIKASDIADEHMVNCKVGKISTMTQFNVHAPDLAEQPFCQKPGERSRQHYPQRHKRRVQARCLSPSSQMWGEVGEQGGIDWPTVASCSKLTPGYWSALVKLCKTFSHGQSGQTLQNMLGEGIKTRTQSVL